MNCVFCDIVDQGKFTWEPKGLMGAVGFEPLNPVVPGHFLIVPTIHVADARVNPKITGQTMAAAATYAKDQGKECNIITSCGLAATQSVFHLHIHVVPRSDNDGLTLPWTGQAKDG